MSEREPRDPWGDEPHDSDRESGEPEERERTVSWQLWVMLCVSLCMVLGVTLLMRGAVNRENELEFETSCNEILSTIQYRLSEHARILWSGSAFFDASQDVTRQEWHDFVARQKLNDVLPGIQGVGFSLWIPKDRLARHEVEVRAEGFASYTVYPAGDRAAYSSIIYLEPFSGRNLRAFSYDMFSEPVRREAMQRACDHDTVAMSGRVTLVQETETDVQAGTLMYTPVYRRGAPRDTVEQRRDALRGWVYSPYRMRDLIRGIRGLHELAGRQHIHFSIFDGERIATETLLYDSRWTLETGPAAKFGLSVSRPVDFAERRWTVVMSQDMSRREMDYRTTIVFGVGTLVTLLLLALSHSLLAIRFRDGQMVEQRATSRYVRSLIEASLDPMVAISADGRITDTNAATERMTGMSRQQLIGSPFISYFSDPELAQAGYQEVFSRGSVTNCPLTVRRLDGATCDVMFNATQYLDDHGRVAGIFGVARDITESKRAEEALRESEKKFRTIIDVSPVPYALVDRDRHFTFLNLAFIGVFGYAWSDIPTMDVWWDKACPGPEYRRWAIETWQDRLDKAKREGTAFDPVELLIRCKDDSIRTVMGSASPLGESFAGTYLIILYDITERKRGEQMEQSLREKETLLKEIHHRVKNNLAVVSSLLALQAKNREPAVRALLEDSQQRVKSMALVHERLYQARNLSAVNFEEYVRTIVTEIISLYQVDTRVIATDIHVENIELDLETAIPCGLLINELLTNAFKYAFPNNRNGRLTVRFTRVDDAYTLVVRDDGVGLPVGYENRETTTLGLELVSVLAGQLGGKFDIVSDQGVRATVTFRRRRR